MMPSEAHDERLPRGTGAPRTVVQHAELVVQRAVSLEPLAARAMLPGDVRMAILDMCAQARAERMPVERMIISLKQCWGEHPTMCELPRGVGEETQLDSVITQCILDFYSGDPSEASHAPNGSRRLADRRAADGEMPA